MPTILFIAGWRVYFYSNEGSEPIHVHAEKGESECKFWINEAQFELIEAYSYRLTPAAKKEIKKILYEHLDYIIKEWYTYFSK